LEHFLEALQKQGVEVLLAGVRSEFSKGLKSLEARKLLSPDHVFGEVGQEYSSSLRAVRHAYERLGRIAASKPEGGSNDGLYYLIR
jgi:hypothetical protein